MSSCPVVYKQTYKKRADASTPGLNVAHLQYIATRPGVVKNAECGFGLWGQLPGDASPRVQTNLEQAKALIRQASETRTLYRGLVSVGKKDAEQFDLYNRQTWERLVCDHMKDIAAQMDIQLENLRWCASMHMKKHHPHVHLIFWDAGKDPSPEWIQEEQFEAKMESIRAAFAGDIHREDIRALQKEQRELSKELRQVLQAMMQDANLSVGLDMDKLENSAAMDDLSEQLTTLLRTMPQKGSLRYQYLPPEYKEQVLTLVRSCLEVPELAQEHSKFEQSTLAISNLYANSQETAEATLKKSREKLEKDLANSVMDVLKAAADQLRCDAPEEDAAIRVFAQEAVREIVPKLDSYKNYLEVISPGSNSEKSADELFKALIQEVFADNRIHLRCQGYAIKAAGLELDKLPKLPRKASLATPGVESGIPKPHSLCGRVLTDQQWQLYQDAYSDVRKYVRQEVMALVGMDVSHRLQNHTSTDTGLTALMGDIRAALPYLPEYNSLLHLLPNERIPSSVMGQIPGWKEAMQTVLSTLLQDARFRVPLQVNALRLAGIDLAQLPDANLEETDGIHVIFGKDLTEEQWNLYQAAYQEEKRELWRQITQQAREDVGWTQEQLKTNTSMLVCGVLRLLAQSAGQRQHQAFRPHRSRDKSKEQEKDERAKRQLRGSMEFD